MSDKTKKKAMLKKQLGPVLYQFYFGPEEPDHRISGDNLSMVAKANKTMLKLLNTEQLEKFLQSRQLSERFRMLVLQEIEGRKLNG